MKDNYLVINLCTPFFNILFCFFYNVKICKNITSPEKDSFNDRQ